MSKTLLILNDPPYGTERSYNGLRLADSLARREGEQVRDEILRHRGAIVRPSTAAFRARNAASRSFAVAE